MFIRPGKTGIQLRLHELESSVMDVVWSQRLAGFTVTDVLRTLQRERDIAYTTVMTTLGRLHEKGLLLRARDGRCYLYTPALTREEFLEGTAREVLGATLGDHQAFAMLAEKVSDASPQELDELEALIRRRREELQGD